MRSIFAALAALALVACGGNRGGDDDGSGPDACVGLECQVVNCTKEGKPPTTLVGTVFAPNGELQLFGVNVYVPREAPAAFPEGAQCSRCSDELSGFPIARVQSDDHGNFRLENVPAGDNIPLVITTGKWRRQVVIPRVESCTDTTLTAAETRLPKDQSEGDLPKIALSTGGADSLECLVRKLGIADGEVTTDTGAGRVHFFAGSGGVNNFSGGGTFTNAQMLWSSVDKLKQYDLVFLSCEGGQNPGTKPQAALNAMKDYADLGGRVFASHWHNIWIEGATQGGATQRPAVWPTVATWTNAGTTALDTIDLIDETANPKGAAFASWMLNVMGSTVRGEIPIANDSSGVQSTGRTTCNQVDPAKGERWTYLKGQNGYTQNFQFTTPNEEPLEARCGKVVFSDMHVSGTPGNGGYPNACPGTTLTPQEKALAFMFFDIASCVGPIF